jgi:hippurate hydrolase
VIYWLGTVEPKKHAKTIAAGEGFPSLHSPFFAPDRIKTIETGVASMSAIALDLLGKE